MLTRDNICCSPIRLSIRLPHPPTRSTEHRSPLSPPCPTHSVSPRRAPHSLHIPQVPLRYSHAPRQAQQGRHQRAYRSILLLRVLALSRPFIWHLHPCRQTCANADWPSVLQSLTEEEQKLFRLYGKLPSHKNVLTKMQKVRSASYASHSSWCKFRDLTWMSWWLQDRKYFDSGDYALSKAGKAPQNTVGTAIPNPEK